MITRSRLLEIDKLLSTDFNLPISRAVIEELARLAVFYAIKGIAETNDLTPLKGASEWIDGLIAQELERRGSWPTDAKLPVTALLEVQKLIPIARRYFPKSIRNSDRFQLENTCATINAALRGAQ